MKIDEGACKRFWLEYQSSLSAAHPHAALTPDAFAFGGGGDIADELARLVVMGRKRATTSLPVEFTALGDPLPEPGSLSIIVGSCGLPVAVIERTEVRAVPFEEVGPEYAEIEGEGDGSLAYWRRCHRAYFHKVSTHHGESFHEGTAVLCQLFRVVWPAPT